VDSNTLVKLPIQHTARCLYNVLHPYTHLELFDLAGYKEVTWVTWLATLAWHPYDVTTNWII